MKNRINKYDVSKLEDSYELTMDNCLKILAFHMKIKCNIPVVLIGETGCGKTTLVKYYSQLIIPPDINPVPKNLLTVRVNGGTTRLDIEQKMNEAFKLAKENVQKNLDTIVFFDEANTTEAIHYIKEIICDDSLNGIQSNCKGFRIRVVAACNPYKKHNREMIEKLKNSGLGFYIDESDDKYGRLSMRYLVYRVQPLPHGLIPYVWDFGQLSCEVENKYISQLTKKHLKFPKEFLCTINDCLAESQTFIREHNSECRFISLRDVERFIKVINWFNSIAKDILFKLMDEKQKDNKQALCSNIRLLILSLAVCYYCSLNEKREKYLKRISNVLKKTGTIQIFKNDEKNDILEKLHELFKREIILCQKVFLDGLELDRNDSNPIAKNQALRENVWMMVICIELAIPLFVIGKPGSSKTLAKVKVEEAMRGKSSKSELYKRFKEIKLCSYQCSSHSRSEDIVDTFNTCKKLQQQKPENFQAVVVLDEIGLAEGSQKMPLKTLHGLLDNGSPDESNFTPENKISFVGISNWALDPAKMNRGLLKNCCDPDIRDLINTVNEMYKYDETPFPNFGKFSAKLARGYLEVLEESEKNFNKFYGLRDFYHLIKMVHFFFKRSNGQLNFMEVEHVIKRNFGGLCNFNAFDIFSKHISGKDYCHLQNEQEDMNQPICIIKSALKGEELKPDNRYVLLITENYSALNIVRCILKFDYEVIFGSSFRKDNDFTHLCLTIQKIKTMMNHGKQIILLNLDSIYESLYNVLNQYYSYLGNKRFVDIGFGNEKMKAEVHKDFRLVVIAEKKDADKFAIPLLNRFEKHYLTYETLLKDDQKENIDAIDNWVKSFLTQSLKQNTSIQDLFKGYQRDIVSALLMDEKLPTENTLNFLKERLLKIATMELVIQNDNKLINENLMGIDRIYNEQGDLKKILHTYTNERLIQVITHCPLLTDKELQLIGGDDLEMYRLQYFESEYQFDDKINNNDNKDKIFVLQTESYDHRFIASVKFKLESERNKYRQVVLLIRLQRRQLENLRVYSSIWVSLYVDELCPPIFNASIKSLMKSSISDLFEQSKLKREQALDCEAVIECCLVQACSLLRDEKIYKLEAKTHTLIESKDKTELNSERLIILKQLLKNNDFMEGLRRKIHSLMKVKEDEADEVLTNKSKNWVKDKVATLESVVKAGNFHRSWRNYIKSKVTPLLAHIISWSEKNLNLTTFKEDLSLWNEIFSDRRLEEVVFLDLKKQKFDSNANEIYIRNTVGLQTQMRLPFSWTIFDKAVHYSNQCRNTNPEIHRNLVEDLKKEPVFMVYDEKLPEWFNLYLHDAIRMFHKPKSPQYELEFQVNILN